MEPLELAQVALRGYGRARDGPTQSPPPLEKSLPEVPPSTPKSKALGYLDDERLAIENNGCERAIRPFVIGRRN